MSYADRLVEFLSNYYELKNCKTIGFESWYTKLHYSSTFSDRDLVKYFKPGEEVPCIMRGSLFSMRGEAYIKRYYNAARYNVPLNVLKRFIRRIKFTCYSSKEWLNFIDSKEGQEIIYRIRDKWDQGNGSWKDYLSSAIREMVWHHKDEYGCIVKGIETYLSQEQYNAIMLLQEFSDKFQINETSRT